MRKEYQKCNIGHAKFEMSFKDPSGDCQVGNTLYGFGVPERSLGDINLGIVDIGMVSRSMKLDEISPRD